MPDRRSGPAPISGDLRRKLEQLCDRLAADEPQARRDREAARRALAEGSPAQEVAYALMVHVEHEAELRQAVSRYLLHNPQAREVTPSGELPRAADGTAPMPTARPRRGRASHAKRRFKVIDGDAAGGVAGAGGMLVIGGLRHHALRTALTAAVAVPTAAAVTAGTYYLTPSETRLPTAAPASAPSLAPHGAIPLPASVVPAPKGKHRRPPAPVASSTAPPAAATPPVSPPAHAPSTLPPVPLYLSTTAVELDAGTGTLTLTAGTAGRAVTWSAYSSDGDVVLDQEHGILSAGQEIAIGLRLTQPDPAGWCTVTVMWDGQEIPVRVTWDTRAYPAVPAPSATAAGTPVPGRGAS